MITATPLQDHPVDPHFYNADYFERGSKKGRTGSV
jgi:hypothetical protein